jgi:hypothetical protein
MPVPDVFGLHRPPPPTEREIDAGADVLRHRQMGGRVLTPWEKLSKSVKRKWREHAEAVLNAARLAR